MADVKLRFQITDDGTVKVLEDVKEKTKGVGEEAEKSSERASKAFGALKTAALATTAAVGAATAATIAAVGRQFQQIDELAKVSRATGVAVRDLSGLQVAADLAGVSLQGLGTSLGIFSRRLVEAQAGVGKSGRIFEALGIDPRSGASTQQFLEQIADRFQELGTGAEATALSMELFGRSGARLINLLVGGGEAIREARQEAELFGLVIGDETSGAVEQFNDNLTRLGSVVTGLTRDLAVALAPTLADISDETVDWATANRQVIASGLAEYLEGLGPIVRTTVDGLGLINQGLDGIADTVVRLIVGSTENTDITRQVARRFAARGMSRFDIDTPGGMSLPGDAPFPVDFTSQFDEFQRITAAQSSINERSREYQERLEAIRAALGETRAEIERTAGTSGGGGTKQLADEFERVNEEAALVPGTVGQFVAPIEQAQRAALGLGDILADSLTSAIDSLMSRDGGFDLGDALEGVGRQAMSRMVSAMLREKLKFDVAFEENFLGFLPRIASQGGDLIAQGFGAGLSSIVQQASNVGTVINGSLRVGGLGAVADTGYGMSLSNDFGLMTSASTGLPEIVSGGAPLAAGAAASGGLSLSGILGPLGLLAGAAFLGSGGFGLFDRQPSEAEISRRNIRDIFRGAGLIRGAALQEPDYTLASGDQLGGIQTRYGRLIDQNRQGTPMVTPFSPESAPLIALATLLQEDPTELSRVQWFQFINDVNLRGGQLYRDPTTGAELRGGRALFDAEQRRIFGNIDPVEAIVGLNAGRLQNSEGRLTQQEYELAVQGTLDLLQKGGSFERGINAAAIAFDNMAITTRGVVVNFEEFGKELERQQEIASGINSGIAGAAGTAAGEILRGDPNARANFGNSVLDAALGGIGQNVTSRLLQDGGALANLQEIVVGAIFGGQTGASSDFATDYEMVRDALSGTGDAFDEINSLLVQFIPLFDEFRREIEDATGVTSDAYRDQRGGVIDLIGDLRFGLMSPGQQLSTLQRNLSRDRATLADLVVGGITPEERDQFDAVTGRVTSDAQRLFSLRGQFAEGTTQDRLIRQTVFDALNQVESALEIAVSTIETQEIQVGTMTVDQIIISPQAAQSLIGG